MMASTLRGMFVIAKCESNPEGHDKCFGVLSVFCTLYVEKIGMAVKSFCFSKNIFENAICMKSP